MIRISFNFKDRAVPFPRINSRPIATNRPCPRLLRMQKAAKLAATFRADNTDLKGGYVTVWRLRDGPGWVCDLSFPDKFRPGCLAVSETNQVFVACGGGYWKGAEKWSLIYDPATVKIVC